MSSDVSRSRAGWYREASAAKAFPLHRQWAATAVSLCFSQTLAVLIFSSLKMYRDVLAICQALLLGTKARRVCKT